MEEIKAPKKERKFLKAMGEVALTLFRELLLGIGKKVINKVGNKRQGLAIALVMVAGVSYAAIDSIPYPITGNKQKLGWQTTGNGLVYRGTAADTVTKPSNYTNKDIKAYLLIDTVNNVMYSYIASKGGWKFNNSDTVIINNNFAQPVDSLFFDTSVPSNNVDTAKMRWDSELATVVLGMYDQVPNELGFKNFWLVKNQTGSTITKGSIVYANGTVGASGRITVAKFIADGTIESKYLLGITAHDLTDGEDGYVISYGKIRQVNTDTFAAGAILYPSPTTAGVWTDVEPVAPNIDMPIGFCINNHVNNGTIAIRVASGYKFSELHDVAITSPVDKASLYYTGGLWRDTTAALLVSDTTSMLTPYFRDADTTSLNLTSRFAAKENTIITGTTGQYYRGDKTFQTLDKTAVGLGNVDNTSDANKPVSTATQTALNLKLNISDAASTYQPILVSGTNIKTVNSNSLLGSGNISVGTVTSVSGSGAISSSGGTTPVISVADAAFGTPGIVTSSGTQQFSGDKVFEGITQFNGRALFKDYTYVATRLGGLSSTDRFATVTIGTGLSLSSGTLSATGGVTSVTASSPLSSSGGTTPNISITDAGTGASGVVNTTTQSFAGNKTFTGTVTLSSATGTATSIIGRSSTGQVVGVTLGSGLNLSSGTLNIGSFTLASLDFPSTSAQTSSDLTVSYTGAQTSHPVMLAVPDGSAAANTNYTAWVSATGTVKVRFNNYSSASVNPASGTFTIFVLNL